MYLYRIHLNPRSKQARRDLADPYQMHATLCRAFFPEEIRCPPGALLWRLEPETDREGRPRVLIQSHETPDWTRLPSDWLAYADPGLDLAQRLRLDSLDTGQVYQFRLCANPCKTVQGKRQGLFQPDAQRAWLARQGERHGFTLPESGTPDYFEFLASPNGSSYADFRISQEQMLRGRQRDGNAICVYSALFEGLLTVNDVERFRKVLETGIGHGKMMGLGLLSVVPSR